jgi:osmoprotectant transport system ATP-binding protein
LPENGVEFAHVSYAPATRRPILQDISLRLTPGATTALLGRSGSGKTTLMRTVNRLIVPTSGQVTVAGRSTADWNPLELRRHIGYVIQETGLFPHWRVERNVGLALELAGKPSPRRVDEVLALAGLDSSLKERFPWQLSGGQRQRVGLARALAADPGILLMDEPFGALDPITRSEMQNMLRDLLQQVRKTVLLVTHDLDEALFLAERVLFLETGAIVADLPAAAVLTTDNPHVRTYVAAVRR